MEYDKTIPVRVPEEVRNALDAEAQKRNVKLAWLIRDVLTRYAQETNLMTIHIPAIEFTGKGDEIGKAVHFNPGFVKMLEHQHVTPDEDLKAHQ